MLVFDPAPPWDVSYLHAQLDISLIARILLHPTRDLSDIKVDCHQLTGCVSAY
jgi:hypothetical protein